MGDVSDRPEMESGSPGGRLGTTGSHFGTVRLEATMAGRPGGPERMDGTVDPAGRSIHGERPLALG